MSPEVSKPEVAFGFTDSEKLADRISHTRFQALLIDKATAVHHIEVSTNSFGEFLFVTMSRPVEQERHFVTFWGLGFHEQRERWLTDEWRWYETQQFLHQIPQKIAPQDAQAWVQARLDEIALSIGPLQQSNRAKLFEFLADLTDEDGALTELEDLGIEDDDDLT